MRFDPEYVAQVLTDNFEDAKALFLAPLLATHRAHLVMLTSCGIVDASDARRLREALDGLSTDDLRSASYDGSCEDLFFYVDRLLVARCGEEAAGRLHLARSRNDIDMTMYRMRLREAVLGLAEAALDLRAALVALAASHRETLFAAQTHTQPAQPTTVAHYLLAVIEQLERDAVRLRAAYVSTNQCPLGACAITGTGFPIDRALTADLLGFDGPTGNTYGSIATVDYLLESASAASVLLTGLGRVLQDLLLWCTPEFGYLRLADGFVQASSLMPQKRNPVALEHARALTSKAIGQAAAIGLAVHNTPFGDIVDTEDDLQPLVATMFRDAVRSVRLTAAAVGAIELDVPRLQRRAAHGGTTLTELADDLVRVHGVAPRAAQTLARRLHEVRAADATVSPADALARLSGELLGRVITDTDERLTAVMSPEHFIAVRVTRGGPAPTETGRALEHARSRLVEHRAWLADMRSALGQAERRLAARSAAL